MSKAMTAVDKQLAEEAANIASTISAPSSNKIKTNDKVFKLPDGLILQAPLPVVIVDYISRNAYYDKPYNEKDPQDPVCWAISKTPADLAPGADVESPMNETCQGCAFDEFGTSPTGAGKACKNSRVMAVLLPTLKDDKLYTIEASPTAIQAFDAFVGIVAKMFTATPIKVITELSFHPEKSYPSLMFGNPQPNPKYTEHFARRDEANDLLKIAPVSGITKKDDKAKAPARKKAATRRRRK
jgi:hypothetical protein